MDRAANSEPLRSQAENARAVDRKQSIHRYLNEQGIATFCDLVDDPGFERGPAIYDVIRTTPIFLLIVSDGVIANLDDATISRSLAWSHKGRLSMRSTFSSEQAITLPSLR